MRKVILTGVLLVLLFFLLPLILPGPGGEREAPGGEPAQDWGNWESLASGKSLRVKLGDEIREMDVNEYLWGVVAAEMPASFELEALKAQAVAARTYALQRSQWTNEKHPDADVCSDHTCCQAYLAPEQAAINWGESASDYTRKITEAVASTGNEVILYEGQLISAVFHSSSGSQTVDSVEVWGGDVPYLVGVESPEGDEVPNYRTDVAISAQDFRSTFLAAHPEALLEGSPASWIGDAVRTSGGSVTQITVGGVAVRGTEMRTLYGLRSAGFTIEAAETELTFHVTGYGHGVGMSQYGANAMAKEGKTYREVLTWYYTGVSVEACPEVFWGQ